MYSTVKYTDDTRDLVKEKLEWRISRDTADKTCPVFTGSCAIRPCVLSLLKSDLHEKRFSDLNDQILKKRHGLVISTENGFNYSGNVYSTRESILRNCAVHWIDDVILLWRRPKCSVYRYMMRQLFLSNKHL